MLNIEHQLHTHLDEVSRVVTIQSLALAGFQNHGLVNGDSDVDTKAIIIPTLSSLALRKWKKIIGRRKREIM